MQLDFVQVATFVLPLGGLIAGIVTETLPVTITFAVLLVPPILDALFPKEHSATVTCVLACKVDDVWALWSDVMTVEKYHFNVKSAELLSDSPTGVGASRKVVTEQDDVAVETVTEEGDHWSRMVGTDFTFPFTSMKMYHQVKRASEADAEEERTEATMTVAVHMKWGWLGRLLGDLAVAKGMGELVTTSIYGMERHLQTGETIGADWKESPR